MGIYGWGAGAARTGAQDRWLPTVIERQLYEAKERGDTQGYLRILAENELLLDMDQELTDEDPDTVHHVYAERPGDPPGIRTLEVRTRGDMVPRRSDVVVDRVVLKTLAEWFGDSEKVVIEVNPGSPSGMRFPHPDRVAWARIGKEAVPPPERGELLLTDAAGPLDGPVAHALACSAPLALRNRTPWNGVRDAYTDYLGDLNILRRDWGVTSPAEADEAIESLYRTRYVPHEVEAALLARKAIVDFGLEPGEAFEPGHIYQWYQATAKLAQDAGVDVRQAQEAIARIRRYEERFRADGVLPPDGMVHTLAAWDFCRGITVIRVCVGARFCDTDFLTETVPEFGALCREAYGSWEDYSAAYSLARVLWGDDDEFGEVYRTTVRWHQLLTLDPDSPWRNIPFG
ncbi:DUF1266 domain-containing protein [Streptomyces chattanoogensis]|uniref:DUF1266 domain-containing protein n=1 Tax=Streptomyces chattanoogensis TaxID=66876 RepID=UPI00099D8779|nr:DUF1266 domain-containing protein [Streptomyces chattanoogensis]